MVRSRASGTRRDRSSGMSLVDEALIALDPDFERNDLPAIIGRRISGRFTIDEWGLDRDLVAASQPLVQLRWGLHIDGAEFLPELGAALVIHTRRLGISEPAVLAASVQQVTGRPLRTTGCGASLPGPLGPLARRLGAVPSGTADLRSLLRAGELVSVPLDRELRHPYHAGPVPVTPITVALAAGVPIIPVAVAGLEFARWWTIRIGRPIVTRRKVDADPAELADAVRQRLQRLLNVDR